MALIKCPECGGEVSDKARACPHCGAPLDPAISPAVGTPQVARRPVPVTTGRVVLALIISFITLGYLVLWAIAFARHHQKQVPIFLIDLLLGWTLIGWLAALIWAFSSDVELA
jgi:cytochrome c biogenesis protein CcdA